MSMPDQSVDRHRKMFILRSIIIILHATKSNVSVFFYATTCLFSTQLRRQFYTACGHSLRDGSECSRSDSTTTW